MKQTLITTLLFIFSSSVYAGLSGNWGLKKGPKTCPQGQIQIKNLDANERALLFGSSTSWTLTAKDKDSTKEEVPESCSYESNYDLSENKFTITTIRKNCPQKNENAEIKETLELRGSELIYQRLVDEKKPAQVCSYNKI